MPDVVTSGPQSSDPFQHLHKMSTTAGLGSGDYVAINGTAIVAILLGVASSIVLFNSWLLLVVPLAGLFCAILAFVQISGSNGTQTGRAVATIGLLLSLGFGGFYSAKTIYATIGNRSDENQIVTVIQRLGNLIKTRDYPNAYNLLDDRLKGRISEPAFDGTVSHVTTSPLLGDLQSADWNEHLLFDTDQVTGDRVANGMVKLKYANSPEAIRMPMSFRETNGKWLIDQIPSFFPEDAAAPQPKKPVTNAPVYGPLGPAKPQ